MHKIQTVSTPVYAAAFYFATVGTSATRLADEIPVVIKSEINAA